MATIVPMRRMLPPNRNGAQQATVVPRDADAAITDVHPRFRQFFPRWEKYGDVYESENLARYLQKHKRESFDSFEDRKRRLYYFNYSSPVVDLYTHYIFSKPAQRKENAAEVLQTPSWAGDVLPEQGLAGGGEELGSIPEPTVAPGDVSSEWHGFLRNVNRQGASIDRFMADAERYANVYGHVYCLVDMPQRNGRTIRTEQDRLDAGMRPYFVTYFPTEMTDWGLDTDLRLLWCRFREPLPEKADPFTPRGSIEYGTDKRLPGRAVSQVKDHFGRKDGLYRTWTRTEWFIHEVKNGRTSLIGQGTHPCGEVPVVPLYAKQHSIYPWFGVSLLADIADINLKILNWCSLIDEEIFLKLFNILCIQRGIEEKAEIVIGADQSLEWQGTVAPFYLAPATDPGAFIAQRIDTAREEIYRLAKLGGGLGLVQPQRVPSGVAQAFEFNETNRTLAERADEIEKSENQLHKLWHRWIGVEWQGTVDYPDDFSVESFADDLENALKSKQTVRSPTFKREIEKKLVRKQMHNTDPETLAIISAEIDALPELVVGPYGPMYFDPSQSPAAQPATAQEISQSPFEQGNQGNQAGAAAQGTPPGSKPPRGGRKPRGKTATPAGAKSEAKP